MGARAVLPPRLDPPVVRAPGNRAALCRIARVPKWTTPVRPYAVPVLLGGAVHGLHTRHQKLAPFPGRASQVQVAPVPFPDGEGRSPTSSVEPRLHCRAFASRARWRHSVRSGYLRIFEVCRGCANHSCRFISDGSLPRGGDSGEVWPPHGCANRPGQ